MKEPLPTTACIRNSGFRAKSKVSTFNKSQCQTESEVLFNPLLLIHAKPLGVTLKMKKQQNEKYTNLYRWNKSV
ncbi:MAG: hypothetical protein KatS3mg028_1355 [Bacteroidia bacterium]|nr:MAG: hypothetical protein KatS3mg028_1355 [Bacteroidia bacterium]